MGLFSSSALTFFQAFSDSSRMFFSKYSTKNSRT
jgi:hypothetical protein